MSFSITNNSATAVVTSISTASSTYGTFSVTSGSFPLLSGQTVSGTNTLISNLKGSPYGTIQLFLDSGDAQIEVYINSVLYSALDYSSGIASIQVPILQVGDTISINIEAADLPVPSATPSVTPSVTPTMTPTVTPTPSSTPPAVYTPASLGALWWIDFTDAATLTISGGEVEQALDKIGGVSFSGTGATPIYNATGYLGVSGTTQENADPIFNQLGEFGALDELTWFGHIYDDGTQNGGTIYEGYETPGFPAGFQFTLFGNDGGGPTSYYARERTNSGAIEVANANISGSTWIGVALRSYNSGGNVVVEIWQNNTIIGSSTSVSPETCLSVTDPQFRLMYNGGIDLCTEQFFFDRKLNNTEMAQMFQYLSDKY